jgi:hypothetical protein
VKRYINLRWVLLATLFPLLVLGLYVLVVRIHGLVRYDPVYFTEEYVEQYGTPGAVALTLEQALKQDNWLLQAELQGRRRPAKFYTSPSLMFVMMWERTNRFFTYLYFDMQTYERHSYNIEEVDGRYVAMRADAYYFFHSGRWLVVFTPLAISWWAVEIVVILAVAIFRLSARVRERMYEV